MLLLRLASFSFSFSPYSGINITDCNNYRCWIVRVGSITYRLTTIERLTGYCDVCRRGWTVQAQSRRQTSKARRLASHCITTEDIAKADTSSLYRSSQDTVSIANDWAYTLSCFDLSVIHGEYTRRSSQRPFPRLFTITAIGGRHIDRVLIPATADAAIWHMIILQPFLLGLAVHCCNHQFVHESDVSRIFLLKRKKFLFRVIPSKINWPFIRLIVRNLPIMLI